MIALPLRLDWRMMIEQALKRSGVQAMDHDRRRLMLMLAGLAGTVPGQALSQAYTPIVRQEGTGVDNLFRLTAQLYRSAQPTKEGFAFLARTMGIKTIVNLREWHSDSSLAAGTGLTLRRVPINTWNIGDDNGDKIVRALRYISEAETRGPVLVHCQHGSDRTGAIIALYRILYQGQSKEAAIKEMMEGGFGFHPIWAALPDWGNIPAYIRKVDIENVRRRIEA
jgi:protein tyrosine phosphatase (PTP) superfamily phosphohydrolase (DUF442 family)